MSVKKQIKIATPLDAVAGENTVIELKLKKGEEVVETKEITVNVDSVSETEYTKYVVVAIAGQSNSVGYDESINTVLNNGNTNPNRIKQLGLYTTNNLKVIPLTGCAENLQNMSKLGVKNQGCKGIHLPLAEMLTKYIPEDYGVLVVPVAYGGTSMVAGTDQPYSETEKKPTTQAAGVWSITGSYYKTLRDRVKHALDLNKENKFLGVIWCQGEHDGSRYNQQKDVFKKMVEQLATDWDSYKDRTKHGKVDKSIWFVYDSTNYWRITSDKTNRGNCSNGCWMHYDLYLGPDHRARVLPLDAITNNVNGAKSSGNNNQSGLTSSAFKSHYGNNAFTTHVAPAVIDTLLKNNAIHGQKEGDRLKPGYWSNDIEVYGDYTNGLEFLENGDVNLVLASNNSNQIFNAFNGAPVMLFDKDVTSVEFTNFNPLNFIVISTGSNKEYLSIIGAKDNSNGAATINKFRVFRSTNTKEAITGINRSLYVGFWDADFPTNQVYSVGEKDWAGATIKITHNKNGKYRIYHNGELWFDKDLFDYEYRLNKISGTTETFRIGIMCGWGSSFMSGNGRQKICTVNIDSIKKLTNEEIEKEFGIVEVNPSADSTEEKPSSGDSGESSEKEPSQTPDTGTEENPKEPTTETETGKTEESESKDQEPEVKKLTGVSVFGNTVNTSNNLKIRIVSSDTAGDARTWQITNRKVTLPNTGLYWEGGNAALKQLAANGAKYNILVEDGLVFLDFEINGSSGRYKMYSDSSKTEQLKCKELIVYIPTPEKTYKVEEA